jgi:hypothetical protein
MTSSLSSSSLSSSSKSVTINDAASLSGSSSRERRQDCQDSKANIDANERARRVERRAPARRRVWRRRVTTRATTESIAATTLKTRIPTRREECCPIARRRRRSPRSVRGTGKKRVVNDFCVTGYFRAYRANTKEDAPEIDVTRRARIQRRRKPQRQWR